MLGMNGEILFGRETASEKWATTKADGTAGPIDVGVAFDHDRILHRFMQEWSSLISSFRSFLIRGVRDSRAGAKLAAGRCGDR